MKYLSASIHPTQITFLRFAIATTWLIPAMIFSGKKTFSTAIPWVHCCRGGLLFLAMALWCVGLRKSTLPLASVLGFSIPLFLLILAKIFLHERISAGRWLATTIGFFGIIIAIEPRCGHFHSSAIPLIFSAILFASIDILNKKFARRESLLATLFYTALATAAFSAIPAFFHWHPMAMSDWLLAVALGVCANLLYFCIIRSLRLIDVSVTAPYRYVEFIFSNFTGYFIFKEIPSPLVFIGVAAIIPSTLYIAYRDAQR
jgi:S-adenosylmethionine uptake transporter